ncbi:TPA: hypothetical protein QH824_003845 [Klebsiella pneumoniae subsp. pneumoniae]|nr:hypothetical protein [Klebsiella pneumoniae subsp. pneumoniae]
MFNPDQNRLAPTLAMIMAASLVGFITGYTVPLISLELCGEVIVYAWMDRRRENSEKPYGTRLGAGQAVSARLVGK